MPENRYDVLFFDVGGVLLSNGWDHGERARAAAHFGLDLDGLNARHAPRARALERGELSLDDYLAAVVFDVPRPFTSAEFRAFMVSLSEPQPDSLALVAGVAAAGRVRLATLNNESRELNQARIERFGLRRWFGAFCSSCYLGERKPEAEIFRRALGIMQAEAGRCLFVDDREENVAAARGLGLEGLRFTGAGELQAQLLERGLL